MTDKKGFSATDFIKKQYHKKNNPTEPELVENQTELVESADDNSASVKNKVNDEPVETISPDTIKSILKQNLQSAEKHLQDGQYWESIGLFKANLQLAPQDIILHQKLADAYLKVNLRNECVAILIKLAGLYERTGKIEDANDIYEKIYQLEPNNELACSVLGIKPGEKRDYPNFLFEDREEIADREVKPVEAKISQDDIPTVVQSNAIKLENREGPKPVEELIPLDEWENMKLKKEVNITPVIENKIDSEGPPLVEELVPLVDFEPKKQMEQIYPKDTEEILTPPEEEFIPEDPQKRMDYYLNIIAIDPDNIDARLGYIKTYLEVGLEQELIDDYLELANIYRHKAKIDEAKKYYQKVLELDPNIKEAEVRLKSLDSGSEEQKSVLSISSSLTTDSDSKQIEQYRRLLQINPLNEPVARKLADFFRSKNMPQEAVEELSVLADAYMQRGMYNKAEFIYQEIVREAPNAELKQKLEKSKSLKKSMEAINQAIKSYKSDLNVVTKKKV